MHASSYTTLLAETRLAALQTLADILAKSEDPTEKRLAAAAILRIPDPKPSSAPPRPLHEEKDLPAYPTESPDPAAHQSRAASHAPRPIDHQSLAKSLATAKHLLEAAGLPLDGSLPDLNLDAADLDLSDLELLSGPLPLVPAPRSQAARLANAAGHLPP